MIFNGDSGFVIGEFYTFGDGEAKAVGTIGHNMDDHQEDTGSEAYEESLAGFTPVYRWVNVGFINSTKKF